MSEEEKRAGCGVGYGAGTLGAYGPGYGVGYDGGTLGAYGTGYCGAATLGAYDFCPDDYFIQVLCPLKGECIKVLTKADEVGVICGRLVTIGRDHIAVAVDGSVAYILLFQITAIIPVD